MREMYVSISKLQVTLIKELQLEDINHSLVNIIFQTTLHY